MSTSDQAVKRRGQTPAWQRALITGHHSAVLAQARRAAATGTLSEVEDSLVVIDTALQSMSRRNNGGGAWRRWLAQAKHALEDRQAVLREAASRDAPAPTAEAVEMAWQHLQRQWQ